MAAAAAAATPASEIRELAASLVARFEVNVRILNNLHDAYRRYNASSTILTSLTSECGTYAATLAKLQQQLEVPAGTVGDDGACDAFARQPTVAMALRTLMGAAEGTLSSLAEELGEVANYRRRWDDVRIGAFQRQLRDQRRGVDGMMGILQL